MTCVRRDATARCGEGRRTSSASLMPGTAGAFWMLIATLVSASLASRSDMTVDVSCLPSRPASGESLTPNNMLTVGGSMGSAYLWWHAACGGRGWQVSGT